MGDSAPKTTGSKIKLPVDIKPSCSWFYLCTFVFWVIVMIMAPLYIVVWCDYTRHIPGWLTAVSQLGFWGFLLLSLLFKHKWLIQNGKTCDFATKISSWHGIKKLFIISLIWLGLLAVVFLIRYLADPHRCCNLIDDEDTCNALDKCHWKMDTYAGHKKCLRKS